MFASERFGIQRAVRVAFKHCIHDDSSNPPSGRVEAEERGIGEGALEFRACLPVAIGHDFIPEPRWLRF